MKLLQEILYAVIIATAFTFIGYLHGSVHELTPSKVEFATERCKTGKWSTIDRNTITCEDGAVYKYYLED